MVRITVVGLTSVPLDGGRKYKDDTVCGNDQVELLQNEHEWSSDYEPDCAVI